MNNLSQQKYWDDGYRLLDRGESLPDLDDFRFLPERRCVEAIESVGLKGKRVLELGAGDSDILLLLSRRWQSVSNFVGLDYSSTGCASLTRRAGAAGLDVTVVNADMFSAPEELIKEFDVVYSIGLVEHFLNLAEVLGATSRFVAPGGTIVTIIPNMSGAIGKLTKRLNRAVYEIHNPHNLLSFLEGHARAGLEVLRAGYLCSTNFGVLSSCFDTSNARGWRVYVSLSRLSKALWLFESRIAELPKSAFLSPYIFAVSRTKADALSEVCVDKRTGDGRAGARIFS